MMARFCKSLRALASAIPLCLSMSFSAFAQTAGNTPGVEWEKRQDIDQRLRSYGPDLMGEMIDPHTGSIVFEHTDVSLPGNSGLEVAIRRKRSQGYLYRWTAGASVNVGFGDWDLQVPRIQVVTSPNGWTGERCNKSFLVSFPPYGQAPNGPWGPGLTSISANQYSNGLLLEVPGRGSQQLLESPLGAHWPTGANAPRYVTAEGWTLTCINDQDLTNGGNDGFLATAPNGDQYRFDRFYSHANQNLGTVSSGKQQGMGRLKATIAATEVTDVHGNWVRYTYDASARLTRIESNDGRVIDLGYTGSSLLIATATANGRTWTYNYRQNGYLLPTYEPLGGLPLNNLVLGSVVQPDGRAWTFSLDEMTAEPMPGEECFEVPENISLTHPYGMVGTFGLGEVRHRIGFDWAIPEVYVLPGSRWRRRHQHPADLHRALRRDRCPIKTLSGPNVAPATWTFDYEQDLGARGSNPGDRSNTTTVTEPGGTQIIYEHYWQAEPCGASGAACGGKLRSKEVKQASAGATLELTETKYEIEGAVGNTFAASAPGGPQMRSAVRTIETKITRDGDEFKTVNTFDSNLSSPTYSYGFPTTVTDTSSTAPGLNRNTVTVYAHNKTKWILGLPSTVTRNGKLFDSYTYDTSGRALTHSKFGGIYKTYTYHTSGAQAGL
ncbi:MAG: hypothetical protein HC850_12595, partial [Rhodomicrobium sp.]|nr:hypothetical protein [Rhodomicrobium sp.]